MVMSARASKVETFLKTVLRLDVRSQFHQALTTDSARLLDERMQTFSSPDIFRGEDLEQHYGDQSVETQGHMNVLKNFIAARIDYLKKAIDPEVIRNGRFADLGDSSGIFLRSLGKKGISVNLSEPA